MEGTENPTDEPTVIHASSERGATATEYAVLLGFLAILTITGITVYGAAIRSIIGGFTSIIAGWV